MRVQFHWHDIQKTALPILVDNKIQNTKIYSNEKCSLFSKYHSCRNGFLLLDFLLLSILESANTTISIDRINVKIYVSIISDRIFISFVLEKI